jgi:DNA-binding NtrC family response regulator
MVDIDRLAGKKVLIVDDEPDVLDTLEDLLPSCEITRAADFEEARSRLDSQPFDLAVLDIMGVNGYELLEITKKKKITAVMVTAQALSVEDTLKSYRKGAAFFIPKDEMVNIATFLNDVLEAQEKNKHPWWRWKKRMSAYYDKRFGPDWQNKDKEFWENLLAHTGVEGLFGRDGR